MKKISIAAGAVLALAAGPAMAQGKSVKIGFVSTFSGPTAVIGNDMRNSFELGLDHIGRKMGGLPVEVIYEDDQQKPEVGKQKTEKLIQSDKVDFVIGYIWSNVLLASLKPVLDAQTFLISTNAGPSQIAGELCSPYFFSTSWQNDQTPQAIGEYMNQKGVKTAYLLGPNYAAGKDMLAGVASTYKGKVIGEDLTKWPDQLDFSAELSKVKAAKPDALFVFYPGAAGVQFLNQYVQSGLKGQVPLYTVYHHRLRCRCRGRASWRSASPAPSTGSTTCPTRPTRSSSPTSRPSTRPIPPSTAPRPTMRRPSSTARWWRSRAI